MLGRLLEEISWEGSRVKGYRDGGRGRENVLTAEVLLPLTFLPRDAFLGEILRLAHGAEDARLAVAAEAERLEVVLLPDDLTVGHAQVVVQPDATLSSERVFTLVEAKRIRRSAFQAEQLAREFVAVMREAQSRTPLLLLVLGAAPPVMVKGIGQVGIVEAITRGFPNVVGDGKADEIPDLQRAISDHVAWITWVDIAKAVSRQAATFSDSPRGLAATVNRLAGAISLAVEWHT